MIDKICEHCGKPFSVRNTRKETTRFCSKQCRKAESHLFYKCMFCGKEASRYKSNSIGMFCSVSCHDNYRKKREAGICYQCGKVFERKKSHAKRYTKEFCSITCHIVYNVRENSVLWKGGERGKKFYPKQWNAQFRRMIRERDKYTCAICNQYGSDVHHKNYIKADTNPENCITLCKSCHAKTNSNREYWISFFSSMLP